MKAFAVQNPQSVKRTIQRRLDVQEKKLHMPVLAPNSDTPPPYVVAVVGPPKVFKKKKEYTHVC